MTEKLNNHTLCFPPHSERSYGFKPSVFICRSRVDGGAEKTQIQIVQKQSRVGVSGATKMYLLKLIYSGTNWSTWTSHINRTLIVWPWLMQLSVMIDIPAAVTSGPQYLIKYQPNIRFPQMNRDPEEFALLWVMKDGNMADRLDW